MTHARGIVLGAVLGGALAGTVALFLTSKKGKKFQRDALKRYEEYKKKAEDLVDEIQDQTESFKGTAREKISEWTETARDVADLLEEEIEEYAGPEHEELRKGILIGGVCGSLIGSGVTLLLTHQGNGALGGIGSQVDELKSFVRELHALKNGEPRIVCKRGKPSEVLNDVLDLASVGMQLWSHIKKK